MAEANSQTLTVTLPSDLEIRMTRLFNAPRQMVFDAYTKPELLRRWFGGQAGSLKVCDVDLRVGGAYRFVFDMREGGEMTMGGVYMEIEPPERLVNTEVFDEYPEMGEGVNTMVLTEQDGQTLMTVTSAYKTKETRDAVIETGMESGANESLDRLAELLAELS